MKVSVDGRRWHEAAPPEPEEEPDAFGCPRIVKGSWAGPPCRCGRPLKPGLRVCAIHDPELLDLRRQALRGKDAVLKSPLRGLKLQTAPDGKRRWVERS